MKELLLNPKFIDKIVILLFLNIVIRCSLKQLNKLNDGYFAGTDFIKVELRLINAICCFLFFLYFLGVLVWN